MDIIAGKTEKPKLSPIEIKNINSIAKREDVLQLLTNSFAPTIFGNDEIKQGLVLQMVGGVEKNLEGGTHLRGDINVLLIGDPSTAKSQFLRHVMSLNPNAINTTGRGSSGVGLTAAVVTDKDSGERSLEAGAMVLADRSIVCIDEFDKMNDEDRVAVHEVMEQQTVTIAKAGIHVSLNARCSVLAAANPIYGEYQDDLSPQKNIGLPESLLSRFDLVYIVRDQKGNEQLDKKISERVIGNHFNSMIFPSLLNENSSSIVEPTLDENQEDKRDRVFEKFKNSFGAKGSSFEIITPHYLQSYLSFVKAADEPKMTEEARQYIVDNYAILRQDVTEKAILLNKQVAPVTVRTLESIIRLATAHAKIKLAKTITIEDAQKAYVLVRSTMIPQEVEIKPYDFEETAPASDKKLRSTAKKSKFEDDKEMSEVEKLLQTKTNEPNEKVRRKTIMELLRDIADPVNNSCSFDQVWEEVQNVPDGPTLFEDRQMLLYILDTLSERGLVHLSEGHSKITII